MGGLSGQKLSHVQNEWRMWNAAILVILLVSQYPILVKKAANVCQ